MSMVAKNFGIERNKHSFQSVNIVTPVIILWLVKCVKSRINGLQIKQKVIGYNEQTDFIVVWHVTSCIRPYCVMYYGDVTSLLHKEDVLLCYEPSLVFSSPGFSVLMKMQLSFTQTLLFHIIHLRNDHLVKSSPLRECSPN